MDKHTSSTNHPTVLVLAGLDPTGGAGIAADLGALASMGVHALPVATCLTVQDTHNMQRSEAVSSELIQQQLEHLTEDVPVSAIKIGLLCHADTIKTLSDFLQTQPDIPVILDPVIRAGGGKNIMDAGMIDAMATLLKQVDILTPNQAEALQLAASDNVDEAVQKLLGFGIAHILVTGTDAGDSNSENVFHYYYNQSGETDEYSWPRLIGHYHGSGCTLAAATAGLIAKGLEAKTALEEAQHYTWEACANAIRLNETGQAIPNRFYWSHD